MKHKHAELIKAWADGATIQYYDGIADEFLDVPNNIPAWDVNQSYRVKPKKIDYKDDANTWGNALNEAAWTFIDKCPEKSTLLFNNCKSALRAAIITYLNCVENKQ